MRRSRVWFGAAVIALGLQVGAQAWAQGGEAEPAKGLVAGDVVPTFDAEGIDGALRHVTYPKGSTTVLLFFLSSCPTCHKMIPEWNKAHAARPSNLTVVGILMDQEPPGFFSTTPISFPVVRAPSRDFGKAFKLQRVPMTVRVAAGGRVEDAAVGFVDLIRLGDFFRR